MKAPTSSSSPRQRANLLWLLFFYLPTLALAVVSIWSVAHYKSSRDNALLTTQRTSGVAARISVFGEQITKSILLIDKNVREKEPYSEAVYELSTAVDRLDQIVVAFNDAAETVAPDGVRFFVPAIDDPEAKTILEDMNVIWFGMKEKADAVGLSSGQRKAESEFKALSPEILASSAKFIAAQQTRLAEKNLAFNRRLEIWAKESIGQYEWPLTLSIILSALTLIALPGVFVLNRISTAKNAAARLAAELGASQVQLQAQSQALTTAKAETDRIMETVQEGLFLIDSQSIIGEHHSSELNRILRQEHLAGRSLLHILERLISEKMFNTTKDYFGLLFDITKKEKTVLKVNPLTDIEINFPHPAGGFINRYLGFSFRRIVENAKVTRVFVAVRDVTNQVELEKKLVESEKHKDRQLDILLGIVHVQPDDLEAFMTLVEQELATINQTLRAEDFAATQGHGDALRDRLKVVFRSVHNLKGNAALLKLTYFQKAASQFESKLAELMQRVQLSGDDFLSVVVAQAGLRADLADLQELRSKLTGLRKAPKRSDDPTAIASPSVAAQIGAGLQQLVADAARELDKATTLTIDEYALNTVAAQRDALVRDVLIQLARNSLAHSIEPAAVRQAQGKAPTAALTVRGLPRTPEGLIGIAFRDDGSGFNLEAIRRRAESSGLISPGAKLRDDELVRLIFAPGFSTAAQVDDHAGRGMGMDIIKSKIVDEAGGAIEVHCTPGKFCEFHLFFPETTS